MDPSDVPAAPGPVIGMVHLPALPGAPGYGGSRDAIRERALADARALVDGGADAVLVENYGDAPYHPESVPIHVVADLTAAAGAVVDAVDVPVGVNVLRNDAAAATSVAAATGADFVRVNVHVGAAATDQGIVEGRAHETLRLRDRIDASVAILADVHVKHATTIGADRTDVGRAAREAVERGRADGVIVSGPGTGRETATRDVERVTEAVADVETPAGGPPPVLVGSGVTPETVADALAAGADGVIVGTALKDGGETTNPVAPERVRRLVDAAANHDQT